MVSTGMWRTRRTRPPQRRRSGTRDATVKSRQADHEQRDEADDSQGAPGRRPVQVGDDRPRREQRALAGRAVAPNAAGTCCKKMMAAIPRVKPSITGQGMNVTARPRPVMPAATTSTPASTVTSAMLPAPCSETIGASTTAIAPVGPET